MSKLTLATTAVLVAFSTAALADKQVWNVTEETPSGLKTSQGQWSVNIDNKKISGSADMQLDNGSHFEYGLDGSLDDSGYTVNFIKRADGNSGCVWSGRVPAGTDMKSHGLIGKVRCDGNVEFTVRAGF